MAETSLNIQYLLKYPCYHRRCYETVYVLFSAYTLCEKKNTLSMRPYIETVFVLRIHSILNKNTTQKKMAVSKTNGFLAVSSQIFFR